MQERRGGNGGVLDFLFVTVNGYFNATRESPTSLQPDHHRPQDFALQLGAWGGVLHHQSLWQPEFVAEFVRAET